MSELEICSVCGKVNWSLNGRKHAGLKLRLLYEISDNVLEFIDDFPPPWQPLMQLASGKENGSEDWAP